MSTTIQDQTIKHYGTLRKSGRYPWGSGGQLLTSVDRLAAKGLSEKEIAMALGISTTELRNQKTLAKVMEKEERRIFAVRQRESGMSVSAIASEMNLAPSTVRDLLKATASVKFKLIQKIVTMLKKAVAKFKYIDIGEGVEIFLGISAFKLDNAITLLKNEGYTVHYLRQEQLGTGYKTSIRVLAAPGTTYSEVLDNRANITIPNNVSLDGGRSFDEPEPIANIASSRIKIIYGQEGVDKDGLIELRRTVPELSLGNKTYAQVRIGIDDTLYLKGMAISSDNIPEGVDIVFYTSKPNTGNINDVLKEQDPTSPLPFGSATKQKTYLDANGVEQISAINIVYEEGDWSTWSKSLSSQFLSKQPIALVEQQLQARYEQRYQEYQEILALTNPTVKRYLLASFSDTVDSDAVFLKAAALPGQSTTVILPDPTMKPGEVYAPGYKNGTVVSLVRYPHGGIFEIPTLTVNNRGGNGKEIIGPSASDAIVIHPDVAKRLSGADFDGDTVIVIPNNSGTIKTSPALSTLQNFDPRASYPSVPGMVKMTKTGTQIEMGKVSNLVTDMTIQGASESEIAQAVRQSMVVIDAEKHGLNYRQAYKDNGISALKQNYQGSSRSGAATLLSRAKSQEYVLQRKDRYAIDPTSGAKIFSYTDKTYVNSKGQEITKRTRSTQLYEETDARKLSSGTVVEAAYANYSNGLKRLGDSARLEYTKTSNRPYSPEARATYLKEAKSLDAKVTLAMRNQPLERKAQLVAGEIVRLQRKQNPDMSFADLQSAKGKALVLSRNRVGAAKPTVDITPQEWEAIQMGAVSPTKLSRILRNGDMDQIKAYATPRSEQNAIPSGKQDRARAMLDGGNTIAEVAAALGVSKYQIINLDK